MTLALRLPDLAPAGHAVPEPLGMPDQSLTTAFCDPEAPGVRREPGRLAARVFALGLPALVSLAVGWISIGWFRLDGVLSVAEVVLVAGSLLAYYWVVMSFAAAVLGLLWRAPAAVKSAPGIDVAILLPMYGEPAAATMGQAVRLLAAMRGRDHRHRFSLHVLSDTRHADDVAAEEAAFAALRQANPNLALFYRHRDENIDYKSGNIRDWVSASGADYEAMLILDADSLMGRDAVLTLTNALAADPTCGLVQSVPRVLPGTTLWQRLQSFASQAYGTNLARGFAVWTGSTGNFLGHNAVIRTRAFAASAGLPHLPGRRPMGGVILSHDFVEAALLRRAGWGVRILPEAIASYEDTPETVLGYVRRDRRWCQGNMQHLRLLTVPGLHPLSRFHLLQGAMAYLSSVWWLCLLVLWAALGDGGTITYFTEGNPMMPVWPSLPPVTQGALAGFVAAMLLVPKLIGVVAHLRDHGLPRGSRGRFVFSVLTEIVLSVLMAPMLMVHQVRAVTRTLAGFDGGWAPHLAGRPGWGVLMRFHAVETALGLGLCGLMATGVLTPWLLPVAVCFVLAVPLSALAATDARRLPLYSFAVVT